MPEVVKEIWTASLFANDKTLALNGATGTVSHVPLSVIAPFTS